MSQPSTDNAPFTASDFPVDEEGRIYHIQLKPEQIAPDILIVGDPGRAEMIGRQFLTDLEAEVEHRGLVTMTGTSTLTGEQATIISPVRVTAATSGIGTSSLEIVIGELVALNEIDFETRTRKSDFPRMHILRVGSSGGQQPTTKLGTPIITSYAIGLDNTGLYYQAPHQDETCQRIENEIRQLFEQQMNQASRFHGKIHPYVSRAEPELVSALEKAAESLGITARTGLTASAPGFFAPQGRDVSRLPAAIPDIDILLSEYDPGLNGQRVENMEMEASFLLHFLGSQGYWAGAICAAIANRRHETFDHDYQESMKKSIKIALLALATLRNQYPDSRISAD